MSGEVGLRPVARDDLTPIEEMFADPEGIGEFNWTGWHDPFVWRRRWEENGLLGGERSVLIVTVDAERAGFVSWHCRNAGSPYQCWEFGISLWPAFRGRGHGTEAQRQLTRYLFRHTPQNRIQASTSAANIAEQRCLEKAGFTREGVLRGAYFHNGGWRDEFLYAIVRAEVPLDL
jgi:RimJ/RimL family protein N-acetyltransferase